MNGEESQEALTKFKQKREYRDKTLVSASPITGRTHQIRVHAAHLGLPIIGDSFYAGQAHTELHLTSYALTLNHPMTKEEMRFELPKNLAPTWLQTILSIFILCVVSLVTQKSQANSLDSLLVERGVIAKSESGSKASYTPAKVYYKSGTTFEFPDNGFTSTINIVVQPRYEFFDNDSSSNRSSFSLERARLIFTGSALNKRFTYKIQTMYDNDDGAAGEARLLDGELKWWVTDTFYTKLGFYKVPISHQFTVSGTKLQIPDRSVASNSFAVSRAQGVTVGGNLEDFHWSAVLTNGESFNEGQDLEGFDTKHAGYASARYNIGGIDHYIISDMDQSEELGISIGAAYGIESNLEENGDQVDVDILSADILIKHQGASFAAEYFNEQTDGAGLDIEDTGFYIQSGYFLTPGELELAARYSQVEYDTLNPNGLDTESDIAVSLNYFFWGQKLKAQLAWIRDMVEERSGLERDNNRVQLQFTAWL